MATKETFSRRIRQEVTTSDGVEISFDLYRSVGGDSVVIICPGFFQSKETRTFRHLATALAGRRDVICMDFRGHGTSGGLYTFSAREGADLEAVLEWTRVRYRKIHVVGFSLGAATVLNTVTRHPEGVWTVVAVSGPTSFEEIEFKFWTPEAMRTGLKGSEWGAGCRPGNPWLAKEKPIESIRKLVLPVLLIHGTRDAIISVRHSHRLYPAAAGPKRLEIIEGGGHAEELFRDDPERFGSLLEEWFSDIMNADQR